MTPSSSRRLANRLYVLAHPYVIVVAFGAALGGFLFLILPDTFPMGQSAVAEWLPPHFATVWALIYLLGGVMILAGVFGGRPNIEAPGFVLLGAALLASTAAVFAVRGVNPGLVAGSTIGPSAVGCLARATVLTFVEPRIGGR